MWQSWLKSWTFPNDIELNNPNVDPDHLIVFQHGLHAFPGQLDLLMKAIVEQNPSEKLYLIYPNQSNSLCQTHQHILVAAEDIAKVVEQKVRVIEETFGERVRRLSFFGHSLGGIYIRAAVGILEKNKWFDQHQSSIEPAIFIACVTPNLGVRPLLNAAGLQGSTFPAVLSSFAANFSIIKPISFVIETFVKNVFAPVGRQLLLEDEDGLFLKMSEPNSDFIGGLKKFKSHFLLINCANDIQVPYYTSSLILAVPLKPQSSPSLPSNQSENINLEKWQSSETLTWTKAMQMEQSIGSLIQQISQNLSSSVSWQRRYFWFPNTSAHVQIIFDPLSVSSIAQLFTDYFSNHS